MNNNEIYVPKTKYNILFECDPAYMEKKKLHIQYLKIDDKIEDIFFDENSEIKIQNIKKIIFAKYGVDDKVTDVTKYISEQCLNYTTSLLDFKDIELMTIRMYGKITGIAKYMDMIIVTPKRIEYNVSSLSDVKTIFINTKGCGYNGILFFIDKILNKITNKINLIIGGQDHTFPLSVDHRYPKTRDVTLIKIKNMCNNDNINKIYVENLDSELPKTYPIPLGINEARNIANFNYYLEYEKISISKKIAMTNFNINRGSKNPWNERTAVRNMCNTVWKHLTIHNGSTNNSDYLCVLSRCAFTLCVHGGGLDPNPKLFEAILVGTIPIIRKNEPHTKLYEEYDLPVVIVDNWNKEAITYDKLVNWHKKYISYFTDSNKRKKTLEKLTMQFWVNIIKTI